jgi:hypothetical protein
MPIPVWTAPAYDAIVDDFCLEILKTPGDLSIENGDIALTKDGDLKMGDTVYSGLFRLVQAWRYNSPHLRFMFSTAEFMREHRVSLDNKMNEAAEARATQFDIGTFLKPDLNWNNQYWAIVDEQGAAEFGRATYGGCLVLLLSSSLLRFKDDIDATGDDWMKAAPLYGGCSFGQVIVAAANGFRHEDEWAKTRPSTSKQEASQKILSAALEGKQAHILRTPGRSAEVLELLSNGGDFERLTANFFTFAHNVALRRRSAPKT